MRKTKTAGRRIVSWIALALAVLTVVGCLGNLLPRVGEDDIVPDAYGSDVKLQKVATLRQGYGSNVTAASYTNGVHLVAYDYSYNETALYASSDGGAWENVLDHPSVVNQWPAAQMIDEIVYIDGVWYFGFFGWLTNSTDGFIFCFGTPKEPEDLGGNYGSTFNGSQYSSGRFTALEVVDGTLYTVSEHGGMFYKTTGGAWRPVVSVDNKPFAGYYVTDITKCGSTYLALGESDAGSVLFTASSMDGTWTMHELAYYANRIESAGNVAFLACDDGVLAYTTNFTNWSYSKMPDRSVDFTEFFAFEGKHYAIGADDSKGVLYESTNGGVSWERVIEVNEPLMAVSVSQTDAFLYGQQGGVYKLVK